VEDQQVQREEDEDEGDKRRPNPEIDFHLDTNPQLMFHQPKVWPALWPHHRSRNRDVLTMTLFGVTPLR
jgi:hypothetical protein